MATVEDTLAAHESRNRELVKVLTELGDDPMETRPIQLHFWSVDPFSASALAKGLRKHGFNVVVAAPEGSGGKWSVEAEFNGSVVEVTASGFVERSEWRPNTLENSMAGAHLSDTPPNIALQRTPSAAPPSPLSFGTLGG